jgi:hypothetical protein
MYDNDKPINKHGLALVIPQLAFKWTDAHYIRLSHLHLNYKTRN